MTMREDEALFTLYKRGWQQNLVPRGSAGWWALALWLASQVPALGAFVWFMARHPAKAPAVSAVLLFLLFMAIWALGFIRWATSRSITVDLAGMERKAALKAVVGETAGTGPAWFAAKRFGYGAGMPIAWQGWALLAAWLGCLAGAGGLAQIGGGAGKTMAFALLVASSAIFAAVAARRTEGGWKWRWGKDG